MVVMLDNALREREIERETEEENSGIQPIKNLTPKHLGKPMQ